MARLQSGMQIMKAYIKRNRMVLSDPCVAAEKNKVNLHYWILDRKNGRHNLGDYLSYVIVESMKARNGIQNDDVKHTRHLYAVGSVLSAGFQNATVWGSGFMNDPQGSKLGCCLHHKGFRHLDVRAVRGPMTRDALLKLGHNCPEIYGDPAILMPMIYTPKTEEKTLEFLVVNHLSDSTEYENNISILTTEYPDFIDRLCSAKRVISSSLHGIILAEAYGIPAVLFLPKATQDNLTLFKYQDYYYGTGRTEFPVAHTIQEARHVQPCDIPEFKQLRENLIKAFPVDLWE